MASLFLSRFRAGLLLLALIFSSQSLHAEGELVTIARQAVDARIDNSPELKGIEILTAEVGKDDQGDPVIKLFGFLKHDQLRQPLRVLVERELNETKDQIEWPEDKPIVVNTRTMRLLVEGQDAPVARLLLIEDFLDQYFQRLAAAEQVDAEAGAAPPAGDTRGTLRISELDSEKKKLALCGVVTDKAVLPQVELALGGLRDMDTIDHALVMMVDAELDPNDWRKIMGATSRLFAQAVRSLQDGDGQALLDLTEKLIRRGRRTPEVWCLRAAGHIMVDKARLATGDLRLACSPRKRHRLFLNFQGALRQRLEELAPCGPFNGI